MQDVVIFEPDNHIQRTASKTSLERENPLEKTLYIIIFIYIFIYIYTHSIYNRLLLRIISIMTIC